MRKITGVTHILIRGIRTAENLHRHAATDYCSGEQAGSLVEGQTVEAEESRFSKIIELKSWIWRMFNWNSNCILLRCTYSMNFISQMNLSKLIELLLLFSLIKVGIYCRSIWSASVFFFKISFGYYNNRIWIIEQLFSQAREKELKWEIKCNS